MRAAAQRPYVLSGEGGDAYTFAAGVTHFAVNPLATAWVYGRLTTIGLTYQQFRYVRLRLEVYLPSTSATLVIGYSPGALATDPPASVQEVCELPVVTVQQTGFVRPAVLELNRQVLCAEGSVKWWTVADDSSTPLSMETQGVIHFYSPGSLGVILRTYWTVEFCSTRPINVSTVPLICSHLLKLFEEKWGRSHTPDRCADVKEAEEPNGLVPSTDVVVVQRLVDVSHTGAAAPAASPGVRKPPGGFR